MSAKPAVSDLDGYGWTRFEWFQIVHFGCLSHLKCQKWVIFEALEEAQIEEIGHFEVLESGNFGYFGHFCSTKIAQNDPKIANLMVGGLEIAKITTFCCCQI